VAVKPQHRLPLCLALSAALHGALMALGPDYTLDHGHPAPPLDVVLAPAEPPAPPPPRPAPVVKPHVAPRPQRIPIVTPAVQAPGEAIAVEPAPAAPPPAPAQAAVEPPQQAQAEAPAAPPAPPAPEPRAVRSLPRTGRIVYALSYGADKFEIGKAVSTWEVDDHHYRLSSAHETTGLAALFRPYQWKQESTGTITPDGLRPETFSMSRGASGEQQTKAVLEWTEGTLTLYDGTRSNTVGLQPDTQDLLSFAFQLALTRIEPGTLYVDLTTGSKLERYVLEVGAEEVIQLPLGSVKAIPIRKQRGRNDEGIEIWLAPEYRYLPVRVRFLDREGKVTGEQLATEIRVSDDPRPAERQDVTADKRDPGSAAR